MKQQRQIKCGLLDNGLRFYGYYDSSSSEEVANIAIMAGSLDDPCSRRGLSHLVEHVVCAGYDSQEEIDQLFARTMQGPNGQLNVMTTWSATVYGPSTTLRKRHHRSVFKVFSQMIKEPIILRDRFHSEKAAIYQECLSYKNDVNNLLFNLLHNAIFPPSSPAYYPVEGMVSHVRRISLKDVWRHIRRYYHPQNTFVFYIGPRFQEVKNIVEQELGDWYASGRQRQFSFNKGKFKFRRLRCFVKKNITFPGICQFYVAVGFPTESYMSKDTEALDVLGEILTRRMFKKLRLNNTQWRQGVYSTSTFIARTFAHGLFGFQFATSDKSFVKQGITAFHEQCENLCRQLIPRRELEPIIGYLYDYEVKGIFNYPAVLLNTVVDAVSNGDIKLAKFSKQKEIILSFLTKRGRERLRKTAQKYFQQPSAQVIIRPV